MPAAVHPSAGVFPSSSDPISTLLADNTSNKSQNGPLSHLSPRDRELFYQNGIGPKRFVALPIVHHAFEAHALSQPNAIAVEHIAFNDSITYAQLDLRSDRLAHRLRSSLGIVPGKRVCVLARRSVPLIISILAILKSGGQYVPLDAVTITDDTLHFVLEDATPSAVLVMDEYAHRVEGVLVGKKVGIVRVEEAIMRDAVEMPFPGKVEDLSSKGDGCYCIYTSGTTGRPKGVDVRHQGVSNGKFLFYVVIFLCLFCFCVTIRAFLACPQSNFPAHSHICASWQRLHGSWNASSPAAQHRI